MLILLQKPYIIHFITHEKSSTLLLFLEEIILFKETSFTVHITATAYNQTSHRSQK